MNRERSGHFVFASIYSGGGFYINVNTYKHTYSKFSSFVKRKTMFFGHLYTSKVSTKKRTLTALQRGVRVCICYVGCWQNTSYTVDTACTQSLSGLAAATHHCTSFHINLPTRDSLQADRDRLPLLSQGQVNPASDAGRVTPGISAGEAFAGEVVSIGVDGDLVSSTE